MLKLAVICLIVSHINLIFFVEVTATPVAMMSRSIFPFLGSIALYYIAFFDDSHSFLNVSFIDSFESLNFAIDLVIRIRLSS
jgi:hypothetical protein